MNVQRVKYYNYYAAPFAVGGGRFGLGIGDILSDNIQCDGSESDLGGCSFTNNFFSVFCSHFDDVGVLCPRKAKI